MRYALLLNSREPSEGEIPEDAVRAMQEAFGVYGRALESAGVLVAAEVLAQTPATTTVTLRTGELQVQDGPFADTKEALAGIFVIEVPDLDAALAWAERCPGAQYGVVEVRPAATSFVDGAWTVADSCGAGTQPKK
ncbi:YciI family protein [Rhodococcus sp. NPDC058521]|uniref:YciI family protein n=1 Tax=Rhodococcus sp. NPDC058521 TaxID=3346536 RepID=UPI003660C0F2